MSNIFTPIQALLKYVEYIEDAMYAFGSLKITFQGSDLTTMIGRVFCFRINCNVFKLY